MLQVLKPQVQVQVFETTGLSRTTQVPN